MLQYYTEQKHYTLQLEIVDYSYTNFTVKIGDYKFYCQTNLITFIKLSLFQLLSSSPPPPPQTVTPTQPPTPIGTHYCSVFKTQQTKYSNVCICRKVGMLGEKGEGGRVMTAEGTKNQEQGFVDGWVGVGLYNTLQS